MALATSNAHSATRHAPHDHTPTPFTYLWPLLRPEWSDVWVIAVFAAGIGLLALSIPITVEALVGTVQGGNVAMLQPVIVLAVILLFCLSLAGAMRAWSQYVVEYIQRRLFVRVVGELAARLPRVKADALDGQHGPELVNRFFDVLTMQKAAATLLLDGLAVLIQGVIGLTVLAIWHPF
ncbi:MAG: peptidase domain-containing ABC transporter, partial [Gemmataceae bacterium]